MRNQKKIQLQGAEKRIRLSDDLIWGVHPVVEALQREPERVVEIILHREKRSGKIEEIIGMAREKGIKTIFVQSLRLVGDGAGDIRHQGVVARTIQTALLPFDELLQRFAARVRQGERPRLVACDSLQDPHNLGAIIRSALASGAIGVILTRERSAPLGGTAVKASAGAVSHIDICQVTNLVAALKKVKEAGAWVFGAVKDSTAQSLYATDFRLPACVVVGSEGEGIRPLVRRECDIVISIPMAGTLDSLNSSVAAAVILFEAMRQNEGPV
ncbi:23S rRNA (guanosine(2251)-2'-O)-methyltransferase RlmB [Desulfoprunum benzoelyticum]|uniref:23S rRNA (Guanosine2251-2'-O)-methyltransferase n=1 Tax=Desulfoprunum benzoelyticum TaxID=1506996 RepID=A0A840UPF5_9BACT|nr:23S rRNA (guanosine(2251)-2'-O)-methyltransferase RlmB [Desulfoprunum benzoelyticum]MBB5347652.1 23S rRNA (guanosine2251-2'-O)-methyltransferase [Desulfoprunum benzoelyticum]MBM9529220.1 23S rRNA (guanosine(2251)-2'-O)-methyltransferase RlmB [Desulfoprunum benzoelyticum]